MLGHLQEVAVLEVIAAVLGFGGCRIVHARSHRRWRERALQSLAAVEPVPSPK